MSVPRASLVIRFFSFFLNPLPIILLIAAAITALLGDPINASIIAIIVVLSASLDFVQTFRSQNAAEKLREQVSLTATVLRDGKETEVPRREIVPGDVIRSMAGDLVPADARLIQSRDLHVNQAALTGESLPVEKEASDADVSRQMVYLGTSVVSGAATALVTATGKATQFGDIAARLATRPPETEFERGTRRFGFLILQTVFLLVLFIIRTQGNPLKSRPSLPLAITTVAIVLLSVALPFSPFAGVLGFVPLPLGYFLFLVPATGTYLVLVEIVKRKLMTRLLL